MAQKAGAATPPGATNRSEPPAGPQRPERTRRPEQVVSVERTALAKVSAHRVKPAPALRETSRLTLTVQKVVEDLERGQGALDKLINGSLQGRRFSQTDLLALQASMYKYSQELDLTSKVVEKATNGLKDTLKTQV
jgi:hypothetical protein